MLPRDLLFFSDVLYERVDDRRHSNHLPLTPRRECVCVKSLRVDKPKMVHPSDLLDLGKAVFSLVVVLLLLSWATVALRIWVRLGITKSPGWDDATMVFTLCL